MRYEKGHKETTRKRIIETAAARFRKDGIAAVGLADIMAEAGLTHGGFYSHFSSKEDLVKAVVEHSSDRFIQRFETQAQAGGLEGWIRHYLRAAHRDSPEEGCSAAALAAELARHPETSRTAFTEGFTKVTKSIAKYLPGDESREIKRQKAESIFSLLMGAIQLSRLVDQPSLSEEILKGAVTSALSLAQIKVKSS